MHIFVCLKTKKIVCILVISVMSNIFKCYQSRYSHPYYSELTFQDIEDFNMYMMFLFFKSFQNSSNVRNPNTSAMACLWIPMLTLHIHSQHLRLYQFLPWLEAIVSDLSVLLGCIFLQESSGFLRFLFLWRFFHRNHDSCSAVTFSERHQETCLYGAYVGSYIGYQFVRQKQSTMQFYGTLQLLLSTTIAAPPPPLLLLPSLRRHHHCHPHCCDAIAIAVAAPPKPLLHRHCCCCAA